MDPSATQPPSSTSSKNTSSKNTSTRWKSSSRRIVRNFTPSWFTVAMGTGMISILLYRLPYNGAWLYWISIVLFVLDIILFTLFTLISALRYLCYPEIWRAMIMHPTESLFLGAFPMSLGIIIEMIISVCAPAWGYWAVTLAWTLWWIEVVISIAICFYLPFTIMSVHKTEIASVTTLWLLPIVSTVVCAATGGMIAGALTNTTHALWTLIVSYILWGNRCSSCDVHIGVILPSSNNAQTSSTSSHRLSFLPLGPLGEGGFGIMKMGQVSLTIFPETGTLIPSAGPIIYVFGFLTALLMWGFALAWLCWAVLSFGRSKSPFNLGWWGIIFATGVFTGSTISLGQEMPSRFFDVLGTVFTVILVLFWIVVSILTICGTISGDLFFSPCVADLESAQESSLTEP